MTSHFQPLLPVTTSRFQPLLPVTTSRFQPLLPVMTSHFRPLLPVMTSRTLLPLIHLKPELHAVVLLYFAVHSRVRYSCEVVFKLREEGVCLEGEIDSGEVQAVYIRALNSVLINIRAATDPYSFYSVR